MIVPLDGGLPGLLEQLREVRTAGNVPLVLDPRWSAEYRDSMVSAAASAEIPEGTAWATLTSGSSGSPRIVLRTAASWRDSFAAVSEFLGGSGTESVALPAPASSSLTLFSLAHALDGGPTPHPHITPETDALHGTPQALRAALEAGTPPRLRAALIGGSHLDPALRERAEAAGLRVTAYYGAAELSFVAYDDGAHPSASPHEGPGLRAFPGVEVEIREGNELWVRSPYVALGYAGSTGPLRCDGAWATVGDRAEIVDGRIRLLGRADDAILSASATIVPEEVEAVLRSIPGVRDAIVFGLPRERVGALVATMLELEPESSETPELARIRELAAARLATAHRPKRWFRGQIPRTASGKPARAEVLRSVLAGEAAHLGS
ncbi:class I adenylate-forming enzyme family protein [Neomicrococcus aestuarii]|uniref:O-succinylbenzoate--CoA ligase n=1 Tax=Neomicrococcus aestuarii TaxID=556325 RepID=A0A1L2ZP78_9MICC|nr:class I adenylate-forming enzyme family protein [Neomicrococcus aestuarii]APF41233.1 o-succinylbenzoate--CoA ligase [Neomicrococcus aestuarii]